MYVHVWRSTCTYILREVNLYHTLTFKYIMVFVGNRLRYILLLRGMLVYKCKFLQCVNYNFCPWYSICPTTLIIHHHLNGHIVFRFYTDYFSQLIGRFRGATQLYSRVPGVGINWPYGKPPDVPRCGFRNDKCIIQGICIKFWRYWKLIHFKDPLMLFEKIRETYFIISLFKGGVGWGQQTSIFSERSRCMTLSLYLLSVECDNLNLYKVEQSSKLILT